MPIGKAERKGDLIQEGCEDKTVLHPLEHIAKSDGEVGDQTHFVIISSKEYITEVQAQ